MGQILRLIKIYIVVMRNSLDKDLFDFKYLKFIKIFRIFFPNLWFRNNSLSRGERIKNAFEELGPIFVKLGQTISTRKDLLPEDIAEELVKLQDKVTPFSGQEAKKLIEIALSDKVENIFEGFQNFKSAVGAYLLMLLFIFLWMLLLIIPGIIAAFSYSMTFYILADDPSISPMDAIDKSKAMMKGKKWKYFLLNLRFLGWALLCLLTFGIGFLWLIPYIQVSIAKFYDDIKE